MELLITPTTTIHSPGAGLSLCSHSVISMDTGWDMCESSDRQLVSHAYDRSTPSCLYVRCDEPSNQQCVAQGHVPQDISVRERVHKLARGILQKQVPRDITSLHVRRGGVAVARTAPRAGLGEQLTKMAGMKRLRLPVLGRNGESREDFWANSQHVRRHLEEAQKKGWVGEIECGRLIATGFKDEMSASSHSFPVDVDDDPTTAGDE